MMYYRYLFRICTTVFLAVFFCSSIRAQQPFSDCSNAKVLNNNSTLLIQTLEGFGLEKEVPPGACFSEKYEESNSIWLKWKVAKGGDLAFTILPLNATDDIDFVLFKASSLYACTDLDVIRCSASGPSLGEESLDPLACTGATGLHPSASVLQASNGCPISATNFLSVVSAEKGDYYYLLVNNFRSNNGFVLEWRGSAVFENIAQEFSTDSNEDRTGVLSDGGKLRVAVPAPNPATQYTRVQVSSDLERSANLQVIGVNGQVEATHSCLLRKGENSIEIPVHHLQKGVYFIKISLAEENHIFRIIKQ